MVFVKSVLVGLLSLLISVVLLVVGVVVVAIAGSTREGETAVAYDIVALWHHFYLPCLVVIVGIFALGFFWEYRRLKRKAAATNP